jgi:hypothetical protein
MSDRRVVASNDDWAGNEKLADTFTAIGAFPLGRTSKDAALITTVGPGNYTVNVTAGRATRGAVLLEIYQVE